MEHETHNDRETCCAICGDEITAGFEIDNGYTVTCGECDDVADDEEVKRGY